MPIEIVGKIATRHSDRICALSLTSARTVGDPRSRTGWIPTCLTVWIVHAISPDFGTAVALETISYEEAAAMFKTTADQLGLTQFSKDFAARADSISNIVTVIDDHREFECKRHGQYTWRVVVRMEGVDRKIVSGYAFSFKEASDIIAGYVAIINAGATKA